MRALRAVDRADVVAVVIDADEGPTDQDAHVAGYARDAYKGIELVVNKWDLVKKTGRTTVDYAHLVHSVFKFVDYSPVLFVSAKTKQRINQILEMGLRIKTERDKRIPTGVLNDAIGEALRLHPPPSSRRKRLKIFYATQTDTNPPTFVFFVNDPKVVHFSYERYLENKLREHFGFEGTPIKLVFRGRSEDRREES
jgi:GTP-binding protein